MATCARLEKFFWFFFFKKRTACLLVACLLAAAGPAAACTLTVPAITIGTYTGVLLQGGTTNLTVNCTALQAYVIPLNAGTGSGATITARKMSNGTLTLIYQLFADAAHTINWGNTSGTGAPTGTGNGAAQIVPIYPQIAAGQLLTPGTYTDTVTATTTGGTPNANTTFTVRATIVANCTISASTLAFGIYTGVQLDATSTLTVNCTNTTPYYINLGNGLHPDTSSFPRLSSAGGALVSYRLYQDTARTIAWRNSYNVDGKSGTGTGLTQTLTVYGRVLAQQYGTPGLYTDTIVATLVY
jgi:spore coat protein U-like protein